VEDGGCGRNMSTKNAGVSSERITSVSTARAEGGEEAEGGGGLPHLERTRASEAW
jgi:hypothetical protein